MPEAKQLVTGKAVMVKTVENIGTLIENLYENMAEVTQISSWFEKEINSLRSGAESSKDSKMTEVLNAVADKAQAVIGGSVEIQNKIYEELQEENTAEMLAGGSNNYCLHPKLLQNLFKSQPQPKIDTCCEIIEKIISQAGEFEKKAGDCERTLIDNLFDKKLQMVQTNISALSLFAAKSSKIDEVKAKITDVEKNLVPLLDFAINPRPNLVQDFKTCIRPLLKTFEKQQQKDYDEILALVPPHK